MQLFGGRIVCIIIRLKATEEQQNDTGTFELQKQNAEDMLATPKIIDPHQNDSYSSDWKLWLKSARARPLRS
jgi:hypothetical protein